MKSGLAILLLGLGYLASAKSCDTTCLIEKCSNYDNYIECYATCGCDFTYLQDTNAYDYIRDKYQKDCLKATYSVCLKYPAGSSQQ